MFDKSQLQERVHKGINFLNEKYPGWLDRIDLEILKVRSQCDCPLGQSSGIGYEDIKRELRLTWQDCLKLGFCGDPTNPPKIDMELDQLTEVWKEEITKLRSKSAPYMEMADVCPNCNIIIYPDELGCGCGWVKGGVK